VNTSVNGANVNPYGLHGVFEGLKNCSDLVPEIGDEHIEGLPQLVMRNMRLETGPDLGGQQIERLSQIVNPSSRDARTPRGKWRLSSYCRNLVRRSLEGNRTEGLSGILLLPLRYAIILPVGGGSWKEDFTQNT
jgi:hypothetical protein